jgi:hypothetical protein
VAEETWHAARLIPTSGINGAEEQERRATSALLAVMVAVREFGRAITQPLGAPAGNVEAFIEVPFDVNGQRVFPDGLVRVTRGKRSWTCLVEVKTHSNELQAQQIENYLDVARENGFDAVLTISNQIASTPGGHPTVVDKRKLRKAALHHLSWTEVSTAAVMQKVHRGVSDPDQAWVLGELIRYLEHPRSGAMEFEDMGPSWVTVREAVRAGTLRPNDKTALDVIGRWDQLIQYLGLRLGRTLGVEVRPAFTRHQVADPAARAQTSLASLCSTGTVEGALKIPNAAGDLVVSADLRAQTVSASLRVDAPRDGRSLTKVRWIVRQLPTAPETLRIDAFAAYSRGASTSCLLRDARVDQALLVDDPKKELRSFQLTYATAMGSKRGQGRGSFVGSVLGLVEGFYADVVQSVKPWNAPPPQVRPEAATSEAEDVSVPSSLVSTALSSQDGPSPQEHEREGSSLVDAFDVDAEVPLGSTLDGIESNGPSLTRTDADDPEASALPGWQRDDPPADPYSS